MSVHHDPAARRFTVAVPSGTAELAYALAGPGVLDYHHTYVPLEDRGRGVADRLAQAAVDYARAQGLRIIPSCSYVAEWLRQHPEHADLVSA
jgi:predicted GNAT family acetyltransferase